MCSIKTGDLKKICKIHKKTPVPQACNFIKKEALTKVFSCEFFEIFKNTYFTGHFRTTASVIMTYDNAQCVFYALQFLFSSWIIFLELSVKEKFA